MAESLAEEPLAAALLAYWERKRGGRVMPDRRDIDPCELPTRLLPQLVLVEVLGERAYRYRLVGTEVVRRLGMDPTGRPVDEVLAGSYFDYIASLVEEVRRKRRPIWSESVHRWDAGGHAVTKRLFLPLAREGDEVRLILSFQTFHAAQGAAEPAPRALRVEGGGEMQEVTRRWVMPEALRAGV